MSQNESIARTQRTRKARLKYLAAAPALIALAAAGVIAGSAGTAGAAASPSALAATTGFSHGGPIHLVGHRSSRDLAGRTSYTAESTNWSGYAATTGTYTSVSASWTQPAYTCSSSTTQLAAFWVGLDGYSSGTVEQTGVTGECYDGIAYYLPWYEVYPNAPVYYSNTVVAGDHFNAMVSYLGSNEFSLYIADTTRGWSHTTTATLAGAARSSAEVIVEAPSSSSGVLPLADFGAVSLTGSMANGSALGNASGLTQIIMVDSAGQEKDTVSSLSGGENFSATWLRSS